MHIDLRKAFVIASLTLALHEPKSAAQTPSSQAPSMPPPTVAAPPTDDLAPPPEATPSSTSVESLDKLDLRDSQMHTDPPVVTETDKYPDFTRQLIRLQWRSGDPIDVYIVRPVGVPKPPVVIYLYGYPAEATRFLNDPFCKTLTRNGYAAVGFSSALTGQRYHGVGFSEWFVSDLHESLVATAHDVQMLLNYLDSTQEFDATRVGMFGQGSGATIAILAASVEPRIKALDLLDPWGDWPDWLATSPLVPAAERPDYLKADFLKSVAPLDPLTVLPQLRGNLPIRLQQTAFDGTVPDAVKLRIARAAPSRAEKSLYKTREEYKEKVGSNGRMLDWMYEQLQAPAASAIAPPRSQNAPAPPK